jgi:SAM-dependent methyltransferase
MKYQFFDDSPQRQEARRERCRHLEYLEQMSRDYHQFGFDYFDNPSIAVGYQGYRYDGRYSEIAKKMAERYGVKRGDRVLEIGCAKGYFLVEFHKLGMEVSGIDISKYAVENAHEDIRHQIICTDGSELPFCDGEFALVICKDCLPHVPYEKLDKTIQEAIRVSSGKLFFEIQCGESPRELENLKRWDGTHRVIETPAWWEEKLRNLGYPGEAYFKILVPDSEEAIQ